MIDLAIDTGPRIGIVATSAATAPIAERQVREAAAARGRRVEVVTAVAPAAMAAVTRDDVTEHDRLVADACRGLADRVDVLCLAQFSMARAQSVVAQAVAVPV